MWRQHWTARIGGVIGLTVLLIPFALVQYTILQHFMSSPDWGEETQTMTSIRSIAPQFDQHKAIKPRELEGQEFSILNARGPYTSKAYPDKPFCVITVLLETGEIRDLMLGYQSRGQRAALIEHFQEQPQDIIGPCVIVQVPTGKGNPMWLIDDAGAGGPEPEEIAD